MGRYYALNDSEDPEVADAVRDHYKPLGPADAVPTGEDFAAAVALGEGQNRSSGFCLHADEKSTVLK